MQVLEMAKGIERSNISGTADIKDIWLDPQSKEFIACLQDSGKFPNKTGDEYMLRIPKELTSHPAKDLIEYENREIFEKVPENELHWWSRGILRKRTDVKVYGLTITTDYRCKKPEIHWRKITLIKAPRDINIDDAHLYRGDTIKQMISKQLPFLIFFNDSHNLLVRSDSLCNFPYNGCFLLISNPTMKDQNHINLSYSEIFTVDELKWLTEPKPVWYFTLPFAVIVDAALAIILLMLCCTRPAGA